LQDLEIPKPNSAVSDAERNDMVDEWFTAWMMVGSAERLKRR